MFVVVFGFGVVWLLAGSFWGPAGDANVCRTQAIHLLLRQR